MSGDREAALRRLLAWFPRTWRERWEEVAFGSLLDDADHRQLIMPGRVEAWSIRAHGLVERLADAARPLAVVALVLAASGAAMYFLRLGLQVSAVAWLGPLCTGLMGPLLIAAVAAGYAYRAGVLTVRGTLFALTMGTAALACGYLAGQSWSVGFDEADAGRPQSWFAAAFVPLLLAGLILGAVAFLPLALGMLRIVPSRMARILLAVVSAGVSALTIGAGLVMPTSAALAAAVLVVLTSRRSSPHPASAGDASSPTSGLGLGWRSRRRNVLAASTAVAGTLSVLFAVTGSGWGWYPGDGTQVMNLGLAAASIAAMPLLAVLGNLLRIRPRYRRSLAPAAMLGALLTMAIAQGVGADSSLQLTFLLIASGFTGLTLALLALPLLPPHRAARAALTLGLTMVAFTTVGLPVAVAAPIAAPVAAIVMLLVRLLRRTNTDDLTTEPAPA